MSDDSFLKKITLPLINRYRVGDEYKRHVDNSMIDGIHTDLACTLFLTPPEEYEGGQLVIEPPTGDPAIIKGQAGTCVVYPCWLPHWVEPVTWGERISSICWIESFIRDEAQREVIHQLKRGIDQASDEDLEVTLGTVVHKLFRMWADR